MRNPRDGNDASRADARAGRGPGAEPGHALCVVVPAYNEEAVIAESVEKICRGLEERGIDYEVLVVDDGSRDGTSPEAAAVAARRPGRVRVLRRESNLGKGSAVQQGIHHARGRRILMCDADLSTPIEELDALAAALDEGADVAIGSRAAPGARIEVRQPRHREWMGRCFNRIARAALLPGILDTQCGFKLFTRECAERVFPLQTVGGFCFDLEILHLARKEGFRIREVPIRWINRPDSRVSLLRDPISMFVDIFRIRLRRRRDPDWHFSRLRAETTREITAPSAAPTAGTR